MRSDKERAKILKSVLLGGLILAVIVLSFGSYRFFSTSQPVSLDVESDLQKTPFGDLRLVFLEFENGTNFQYMVHVSQVDRLVTASKKLHYEPGVNPHNGVETTKLARISVGEPYPAGPYWWSTPDLQENQDKNGAILYLFRRFETVWEVEE